MKSNPVFGHAQTKPNHKKEVEILLKEVIDNNLEGNEEARVLIGEKE